MTQKIPKLATLAMTEEYELLNKVDRMYKQSVVIYFQNRRPMRTRSDWPDYQ